MLGLLTAASGVLGGGGALGGGSGATGATDTQTVETKSSATAGSGTFSIGGGGKLDTQTLLILGAVLVAVALLTTRRR